MEYEENWQKKDKRPDMISTFRAFATSVRELKNSVHSGQFLPLSKMGEVCCLAVNLCYDCVGNPKGVH